MMWEYVLAGLVGFLVYTGIAYAVWKLRPILRGMVQRLAFWHEPIVAAVPDGDTLKLSDGRTVRLIGIDTPEAHECKKLYRDASATGMDPYEILERGRHAGNQARLLAEHKRVRLEYDWRNIFSWHQGKYGRTLAYVWILDQVGGKAFMLNEEMLRKGLALCTGHNHKYRKRFKELEREAGWIGGVPRDGQYSKEDWEAAEEYVEDASYEMVEVSGAPAPGARASGSHGSGAPAPQHGFGIPSGRAPTTDELHELLDRYGVPPLREDNITPETWSPLGPESRRVDRRMKWLKEHRQRVYDRISRFR